MSIKKSKKSLAILLSEEKMSYRIRELNDDNRTESEELHYQLDEVNKKKSAVEIKYELESGPLSATNFDYVHICFLSTNVCLVPNEFLTEPFGRFLYQSKSKVDKLVIDCPLVSMDATLVFDVHYPLKDILLSLPHLSHAQLYHSGKLFLDEIVARNDHELHLNFIQHGNLELALYLNKKLVLYNLFKINKEEEFFFYIFYVVKQFKLNQDLLEVTLYGNIRKDEKYYSVLSDYIRKISFYDDNDLENTLSFTFNKLFECELYQEI